ncbi:MAG: Asp-tRNA(Asn)/Glu-tRNA(Gln) amidotransferase subunit GatA [Bradymonadaceae bacterium]|nr:Asp-tRNA(Asn)/Glu-tRNA(Gln) amidotransferase subunit GatA [Lujinxingiaceae bacterium]
MKLNELTMTQLKAKFDDGQATASAAVADVLSAIEAGQKYNAYITVCEADTLFARAERIDKARISGAPLGALAGVPIAIKDNMCMKGVRTTAGSRMLENFIAPYDATVVERLEAAGAIIVGKTNLDEFAMGSSNETSFFGPVKNPRDSETIPGGSSGGSAAAVAANLCSAALGSDTGGSVRQPASHTGTVGLKPTYGRVSRFGLIAFASSLDQIGPMTKSVEDAALLLEAIAGHDPRDATSVDRAVPAFQSFVAMGVEGMRLGIPREYFEAEAGVDPDVLANVRGAIQKLEEAGATIVDISLPHTEYAVATYYLIATAEASSNLARYDGVRYGYRADEAKTLLEMYERTRAEGFGDEIKRRIMLGTFVLSTGYYDAYYRKAQQVRTLISQDFDRAFSKVDAIVTPTAPSAAFRFGQKSADPLQMYLEDIYTISCNLAGLPGISVPCGTNKAGLPTGLQMLAPRFEEATLFRVAGQCERSLA